jgi:O-acetyl-ADP-ribose deacetylase (regulator of RNase III)
MIKIIDGDLLEAKEKHIAHQCNCTSSTWSGVAKAIFEKFPYSNSYDGRNESSKNTLGTIDVFENGPEDKIIINMYAQFYRGKPGYGIDSYEERKKNFISCLEEISKIKGIKNFSMPYKIGCGLAGGIWEEYLEILEKFSKEKKIDIFIYKKD